MGGGYLIIVVDKFCLYVHEATVNKTGGLKDYKFFCFNGKPKIFKIDYDRFEGHRANYYCCLNNEILYFGEVSCPPDFNRRIRLPGNIELMKQLAETLSAGTKFLRVDFYETDDKVYFGELTFYPASGFGRFTEDKWDEIMGNWILL